MKNIKKKGFTLVELVIVIAVIAILAGVLIGTFASVLKRANESARVQQIKNDEIAQKADDIIKKIEDSNWFGWEDFEASLVAQMTEAYKKNTSGDTITEESIQKVVKKALEEYAANQATQNTALTEDQVKAIVENAIGGIKFSGVTEAQVRSIVNAAVSTISGTQLTAAQVRAIVNAANENNLTANDLARALADLPTTTTIENLETNVKNAINNITRQMLTEEQVADVIKSLVPVTVKATDASDAEDLFNSLVSGSTIVLDDVTGDLDFTLGNAETKTIVLANNKEDAYEGTITISGARATIYLIGDFKSVVAEKVDTNSIHVLGNVKSLIVKQGRAVVENGASVEQLTAMPNLNTTVIVVVEESAQVEELNAQYQDHGYADGNRDYIEIENKGTIEETNITASDALVTSQTTTTNVVIKNGSGSTGASVEDINVGTGVGSFDVTVDETNAIANANTQKVEVALFAGGTGTADDPYLIATAKQMQNISLHYNDATESYYKVKDGVTTIECSNWKYVKLFGSFDGNNVKFVNLDSYLFGLNANELCVIKNFSVSSNITTGGAHRAIVAYYTDCLGITEFNNILVEGYIEGNCVSPYLAYGYGDTTNSDISYRFINCEARCTLVSTGEAAAGFICHPYWNWNSGTNSIYVDNSKFTGKMYNTTNKFLFFCTNYAKATTIYVKGDIGISKMGSSYSVSESVDEAGYATITKNNVTDTGAYAEAPFVDSANTSLITKKDGTLPSVGETFTVNKDQNASYAIATLMIGPDGNGTTVQGGNYTGIYLTETLQASNDVFTSVIVKNYDVVINGEDVAETGIDGNVFNIVNNNYGTTYGSATVKIIQYSEDGTITSITTYNIKR